MYCTCTCTSDADLRIVGDKYSTDQIAPNTTAYVYDTGSQPAKIVLNVSQDKHMEQSSEEEMDNPVRMCE